MANLADLEKIANLEEVSQYILLAPGGQVISHNMDNHVIMSSMVMSCASICKFISAERFHYLVFAQEDNRDFFIFPVGKHYLAVFKNAEFQAHDLPKAIASFIKNLVK